MSSNKERMKILNKIRDGKITAEDGARLLAAYIEGQGSTSVAPNRLPSGLMLHIRVTDIASGRSKANVQLPLSVVDAGMKIGARFIPETYGADMSKFMNAVRSGVVGKVVEITDVAAGEHVEVFIE